MRVAFVFPSIPTRNDKETDIAKAVIEKKDWLGQEAEYVAAELKARYGSKAATSVHIMYTVDAHASSNGVEWFATRPRWPMTKRYFYQGKQWSSRWCNRIIEWKPDIIHWQMNSYAYTFNLAARRFLKAGIPYVYQHHGPRLARKAHVKKVLQFPNRAAARGIYLTRDHEREYREGLGLDQSRNVVIPVGYDERFRPLDRAACRAKTNLKGDPTLLCVGGMSVRKDPLTLLKAFARVGAEFPNAHFYFAGYGPLDQQCKDLVASDPVLRSGVTLMGYVNNADLPEIENAADIFVMGSHGEGFAVASMEAMACGLFPVLTRLACFVEQTDDGRLGLLFTAGNVDECAACLRKAISDVAYRENIRKQLPETVAKMTWGYSAKRLVDLYADVLGKK